MERRDYTFEVGKTYETRDGRKAVVVEINVLNKDSNQLIALVYDEDGSSKAYGYYKGGNYLLETDQDCDLMPPEPEKKYAEGWANIYDDPNNFVVWSTKDIADKRTFKSRVACVPVKIEYYEGQGLKDKQDGFV